MKNKWARARNYSRGKIHWKEDQRDPKTTEKKPYCIAEATTKKWEACYTGSSKTAYDSILKWDKKKLNI